MAWCLIKSESDKIRKAFKDGTIDPVKLAGMSSLERRELLGKFVGEENAKQINALFESKLLLKNQKAGMISWAKKVVGITPKVRQDIISKIERMDRVLNPQENEVFLQDLAEMRLGVSVTQEEAKNISDMSQELQKSLAKISEDSPIRSKERMDYGLKKAVLKEYIAKLKDEAKKITFREQPARKVLELVTKTLPDISQSIMTSYDNSLWGRQLNSLLFTPRYTKKWINGFVKSWGDIANELRGVDAQLLVKADVYSRPNAINGKYDADPNGYGLGVQSEEVYSSQWPAKIPVLGRLFKASESAFNGGALRVRADIADLEISVAEKLGVNVLDKKEAGAIGSLVTSITGRGSVGGAERFARQIFWAPRMYVGQLNQLTAHIFDPKANPRVKKQAAKNLVSMLSLYGLIFALSKYLDPSSVDEKEHLGQIKIWGKWVDITGGKASYIKLVNKMATKMLSNEPQKYGEASAWDDLVSFAEGKLAPNVAIIRDIISKKLYGGEKLTPTSLAESKLTPISYQTWSDLEKDPSATNILGLMLLESLGLNVSSYAESNAKTNIIPENKKISNDVFIDMVMLYAKAFKTDPETAFNRIFTGQKIRRIDNGTIIVERMPLTESQEIKKNAGANNPQMKLDHTIPLELGGSNEKDNLKLVTTSQWSSYTKIENALGKALREGKITKKEAQSLIVDFKSGKISSTSVLERIK